MSVEDNYLKAVGRVLSGDGPVDKHKASQVWRFRVASRQFW